MLAEGGLGMGLVQYKLRGSGNGTCTVQAVRGYMQYKLRRGFGNGTTYVYMSNIYLCFMFYFYVHYWYTIGNVVTLGRMRKWHS